MRDGNFELSKTSIFRLQPGIAIILLKFKSVYGFKCIVHFCIITSPFRCLLAIYVIRVRQYLIHPFKVSPLFSCIFLITNTKTKLKGSSGNASSWFKLFLIWKDPNNLRDLLYESYYLFYINIIHYFSRCPKFFRYRYSHFSSNHLLFF